MKDKPTYQELENRIADLQNLNETIRLNSSIQSNELYNSLIDNMAEGFAHCQMIYELNNPIDFIYLKVNKAFETLTGLINVEGKHISEILLNHKDENPELFYLYDKVSKSGVSEKIETFVKPLKKWFSISVYSSIKGQFLVFFDNITERKNVEKALRLSEEKFHSLFIQSHVGTAIVGLDKCFKKCNQAFCSFLGYSENEIIGKRISDFTHPDDQSIGMEDLKKVVGGKISHSVVQKRYIKKNNSVVWGELTISLVHDENKKPLYFLPIIQDITERHLAYEKLKRSESNLKKLNNTKDKLMSIIAHDLRSPFNGILGFTELLIDFINNVDLIKAKKFSNTLLTSVKSTLILLDNLLNWVKSQTNQIDFIPEKICISPLFEEITDMFKLQSLSKNITIEQVQRNDIEVYADKNLLKIILQNLLSNAIKFTNQGGVIKLNWKIVKEYIQISISDNGLGIKKEDMDRLFSLSENFTTVGTQNEKGSGLGLVLCKEIVEKHGGEIRVKSVEGKGSDFIFTIPFSN